MKKTISQAEARALRKRVRDFEAAEQERRCAWAQRYPGGTHIATITVHDDHPASVAIRVARKLDHAVIAVNNDRGEVLLYALPPGGAS